VLIGARTLNAVSQAGGLHGTSVLCRHSISPSAHRLGALLKLDGRTCKRLRLFLSRACWQAVCTATAEQRHALADSHLAWTCRNVDRSPEGSPAPRLAADASTAAPPKAARSCLGPVCPPTYVQASHLHRYRPPASRGNALKAGGHCGPTVWLCANTESAVVVPLRTHRNSSLANAAPHSRLQANQA
jgi:hypothetical protein